MKIFRCPKSGRFPVLFYQLHLKVHPVAGMRCILLWKINRQSIGKSFLMIPFALSSPGNLHIFCAKTPVPFSILFYLIKYRPKVLKKSPSSLTSCRKGQGCQSHLRLIAGNRLLLDPEALWKTTQQSLSHSLSGTETPEACGSQPK